MPQHSNTKHDEEEEVDSYFSAAYKHFHAYCSRGQLLEAKAHYNRCVEEDRRLGHQAAQSVALNLLNVNKEVGMNTLCTKFISFDCFVTDGNCASHCY